MFLVVGGGVVVGWDLFGGGCLRKGNVFQLYTPKRVVRSDKMAGLRPD